MKRNILSIIIAASTITSFSAMAIVTGLNGVTSGAQADAINNAYGNNYVSAKNETVAGTHTVTVDHSDKITSTPSTVGQLIGGVSVKQSTVNVVNNPNLTTNPVLGISPGSIVGTPQTIPSNLGVTTAIVTNKDLSTQPVAGLPAGTIVGTPVTPIDQNVTTIVTKPNLSTAPVAGLPAGSLVNGVPATTVLSSTTVANTTGAAALQAALTASKMASSAAAPGVAPSSMNTGVKTNPVGNPVVITSKVANSSINVGVSSVAASTPVQVGNIVTTAGAIAAIDSTIQISIPYESVFNHPVKSVHSDHQKTSRSEHGTGNGSDNAQASRSAGGFSTAGSHIGGGRSGGGFHY